MPQNNEFEKEFERLRKELVILRNDPPPRQYRSTKRRLVDELGILRFRAPQRFIRTKGNAMLNKQVD